MKKDIRELCFSILSLLLLAGTEAYAQPIQARVVGGTIVADGAYPFVAALVDNSVDPSEGHFCGGTLVAPDLVLTAAHCVDSFAPNYDVNRLSVLLDRTNLAVPTGIVAGVKGIIVHPKWNPDTLFYDFALIRLLKPVPVTPLPLIDEATAAALLPATPLKVLGWGFTDYNYPILPNELHIGTVPLIDDNQCYNMLGRYFNPASMVCAGKLASSATSNDGVDSNKGDSGGPLLLEHDGTLSLVGVVSWGLPGDPSRFPGVYSRITAARDWILSNPPIAPYITEQCTVDFYGEGDCQQRTPEILGSLKVGNTVTCDTSGVVAEQGEYKKNWYRTTSFSYGSPILVQAGGDSYKITQADAGYSLFCKVDVVNVSGSLHFYVTADDTIQPADDSSGDVTTDTTPPTIAKAGVICSKASCKVYIFADDDSGIQRVFGTLRRKNVKVKRAVPIDAIQSEQSTWEFDLTARKIARKSEILVRAIDYAGNTSVKALRIRLPAHQPKNRR